MANNDNPFFNAEKPIDAIPTVPSQPQSTVNLNHIRISDISGPLVVFFGPRNIGKTVTLIRLCNFISRFEIRANETFRTDRVEYKKTIDTFESIRIDSDFAPAATGNINFLLLDVTYHGNRFCQILEAPGEHFFDTETPSRPYPAYFNQILNSDYRKVFVFFFEINQFDSDQDRKNYADKIARLTRESISSKRDKVIIVCNKCDLQSFLRNGRPVESEYRNALYNSGAFTKLADVLNKAGFGRVPFVPFSAGAFTDDGTGKLAFSPSSQHYPQRLWQEIYDCVEGKPWYKFW